MSPKGPVSGVWSSRRPGCPEAHHSPPPQVTPGSVSTLRSGEAGAEGPVYADEIGDQALQAAWGPPPLPGPSSATPQSPGDLSGRRERVSAPGRPGSHGKWLSGTASSLAREPRPLGPATPKPGTQSALGTQRSAAEWGRAGTRERQRLRPAAVPWGSDPSPACLEAPGWPAGAPGTDALLTGWPRDGPFRAACGRAVNLLAPHISGPHSPAVSPLPREQRASQSNLSLTLSSLNKDSSFQHQT